MSDLPNFIQHLYEEYRELNLGSLASYMGAIGKSWFGIWRSLKSKLKLKS